MNVLDFTLPRELEAHEPAEARGLARDDVRLLVGSKSTELSHHRFAELPELLCPGDVLVVTPCGPLPAAVPVVESCLSAHFSTELSDGRWLVELRKAAGKAPRPHD